MTKLRCSVAEVLSGALAFLFILAADKALAQAACSPADQTIRVAGKKSQPGFEALVKTPAGSRPTRMFANPATGSWTLITLEENGMACLAGTGQGFRLSRRPGNDA